MVRQLENDVSTTPDDVRAREDEWVVVRCQLGERSAFDDLVQRREMLAHQVGRSPR